MITYNDLNLMNNTMIAYQKRLGVIPRRNEIIQEMLKDRLLFKKLSMTEALIVLSEIGVGEQSLATVYQDLKNA